jgi:histidine ammonia-lyase
VCIHLLCSTQALDLRIRQLGDLLPVQTGKGSAWLHEKLRHHVPFVSEDRFLHRDLQTIERLYEELTAQAQAFFGEIGQA